ncbi:hypothetical protein JP0040_14040 [Helicobacter pylori]|nr:hypothetical protein JP0040_14040 [Helicobacter pylori]
MNDKRFRKYWSFSIFLSLLGMFELEAKEEEKEERKTERKKDKKKERPTHSRQSYHSSG